MLCHRTPLAARAVALASVATLLTGCATSRAGAPAAPRTTLTVLAAASLVDVFGAEAASYEHDHPGVRIESSFAGSQVLVAQIQAGAPADVLATADTTSMGLVTHDLVAPAQIFATNRLVIVVRPGNPAHVTGPADLGRAGLVLVLAAPSVPAGRYALVALNSAHVRVHPAAYEENVRAVLTTVELGEADAGIVYATDARSAGHRVTVVPLPTSPVASYPVAPLAAAGTGFVAFLLSPAGRR
ncbi:MAG TPA: molybdate ABC transporter substrate-binding protein, partial [Mycobacteriales bacterium]|nr:molybdate ABC transporter substrate-binding protein [Mycobacteriales bacterium]